MPQQVPIQAIPSQEFSIELDSNLFDITISYTAGVMSASFTINGTDTLDNIRCVAGTPLLPYKYLEAGNFVFITSSGQLPNYELFGISQTLIYLTAAELMAYRASTTYPINSTFFNPAGGLPLRFSPQGYH